MKSSGWKSWTGNPSGRAKAGSPSLITTVFRPDMMGRIVYESSGSLVLRGRVRGMLLHHVRKPALQCLPSCGAERSDAA